MATEKEHAEKKIKEIEAKVAQMEKEADATKTKLKSELDQKIAQVEEEKKQLKADLDMKITQLEEQKKKLEDEVSKKTSETGEEQAKLTAENQRIKQTVSKDWVITNQVLIIIFIGTSIPNYYRQSQETIGSQGTGVGSCKK